MSPMRRFFLCLAPLALAVAAAAQSNGSLRMAAPASTRPSSMKGGYNVLPGESPVDFFRKLLALQPAERDQRLASRPPAVRERILAKVREYEALDPAEREMRLRATELRYYLLPLMRLEPSRRSVQLSRVPADLAPLVKSRLIQWDLLPPPIQQEFLSHDVVRYFTQPPRASANDARTEKYAEGFEAFFRITPEEKERLLDHLSEPERLQMEKTLKTFEGLPAQQQLLCEHNYAKFLGMSAAERAEFLKNADNWSKMSAEERRTWQDLVANVPLWPPMPPLPSMFPPLPPTMVTNTVKDRVATNF